MKMKFTSRHEMALTLLDVLVLIAIGLVVVFLVAASIGTANSCKRSATEINCINNLKQVGLAYRIWEG
jgi:hypothetical protein